MINWGEGDRVVWADANQVDCFLCELPKPSFYPIGFISGGWQQVGLLVSFPRRRRVHIICATFFCAISHLRDISVARHPICATFQMRDIPSARHPICATIQLRDISTARYPICATSQLRDIPFARLFNCATSHQRDIPFARLFNCATSHLRDFFLHFLKA